MLLFHSRIPCQNSIPFILSLLFFFLFFLLFFLFFSFSFSFYFPFYFPLLFSFYFSCHFSFFFSFLFNFFLPLSFFYYYYFSCPQHHAKRLLTRTIIQSGKEKPGKTEGAPGWLRVQGAKSSHPPGGVGDSFFFSRILHPDPTSAPSGNSELQKTLTWEMTGLGEG